jgi:hypothetical protein
LTSVSGQRIARHTSKPNEVKRPFNYAGLLPGESGISANPVHRLLVSTERSILHLSFRLSRPGGRAPPVSI